MKKSGPSPSGGPAPAAAAGLALVPWSWAGVAEAQEARATAAAAVSTARTAQIRRGGRCVPHPRIMSGRPESAIRTPPPSDRYPDVAEAPCAPRAHVPGGPTYKTGDVGR